MDESEFPQISTRCVKFLGDFWRSKGYEKSPEERTAAQPETFQLKPGRVREAASLGIKPAVLRHIRRHLRL